MACGWSKWKKYRILAGGESVRSALPASHPFDRETLSAFLDRYRRVVVKPTGGSGGKGVTFVADEGDGRYRIRSGARKMTVHGRDALYRILRRRTGNRRCLIQQKIPLARVGGRPFDVRVMVQRRRKPGSRWKVTAKLARIAGRGYLITNTVRSGGRVTTFSGAIRRSNIRHADIGRLGRRINGLCLRAVRLLHERCCGLRTVGFDIGVDKDGKPWILEANFRPSKKLFLRLRDKTPYRRIMRY